MRAGDVVVVTDRGTPVARIVPYAVTADIVRRAVGIEHHVRSLDAIHLATALHLGSSLRAFVTYDRMLGAVAGRLGLPVVAPTS